MATYVNSKTGQTISPPTGVTPSQSQIAALTAAGYVLQNNTDTTDTTSDGGASSETGTKLTPEEMQSYAMKTGITLDVYNALSDVQKATVAAAGEVYSSAAAMGNASMNLDDALKEASTDPSIVSKYADAASIDKEQFAQQLGYIQATTSTTAKNQQNQFENDRTNLNKAIGAAGMAYSSYADEARKTLSDTENGIVTSTRTQLQGQVNDLTSAFEAKYGTAATTPAQVTYAGQTSTGQLAGANAPGTTNTPGIIGSQNVAKSQDIVSLASSNLNDVNAQPTVTKTVQ